MNIEARYLIVEEIFHRMKDGKTGAWLCKAEDKKKYVIKTIEEIPPFELIAEWVAGNLAIAFGLSSPQVRIMWGMQNMLGMLGEWVSNPDIETSFGSTLQPDTIELSYLESTKLSETLKTDLLVFDYWIQNGDRTLSSAGGNVNLLKDIANSCIVVFDHNQAFKTDFDDERFFSAHVFTGENKGAPIDLVSIMQYKECLDRCIDLLPSIINAMPEEWRTAANAQHNGSDVIDDIIYPILNRYKADDFWGRIKP